MAAYTKDLQKPGCKSLCASCVLAEERCGQQELPSKLSSRRSKISRKALIGRLVGTKKQGKGRNRIHELEVMELATFITNGRGWGDENNCRDENYYAKMKMTWAFMNKDRKLQFAKPRV